MTFFLRSCLSESTHSRRYFFSAPTPGLPLPDRPGLQEFADSSLGWTPMFWGICGVVGSDARAV